MIKGNHVGLRAISREDLPQLLEWRNLQNFRRYFREYRELSLDHQINWYKKTVLEDDSIRMFAIEELSSRELIGACGLCLIDFRNRNADLSIYIGKDALYIDQVYAPDAAWVLVKYGFDELKLHRIWAEIYSTDKSKQAFFDGLGFTVDGRHRDTRYVENKWVDSLFYSILEDEFDGS